MERALGAGVIAAIIGAVGVAVRRRSNILTPGGQPAAVAASLRLQSSHLFAGCRRKEPANAERFVGCRRPGAPRAPGHRRQSRPRPRRAIAAAGAGECAERPVARFAARGERAGGAAEADLPGMLRGNLSHGLDPQTAVRLAAATLAGRVPFALEACDWVAGELAIALGIDPALIAKPHPQAGATALDTVVTGGAGA